jgi:hypothetical protein
LVLVSYRLSGVDGFRVSGKPGQDVNVPRDHDGTDEVIGGHLNLVIGEQLKRNVSAILKTNETCGKALG